MSPILDFSGYITGPTRDFTGREWVFQAIASWLRSPVASRYFLLTGEPGSGKSAIAARLTQISSGLVESMIPEYPSIKPGVLSAIHFCSARERQWINPHAFTESLALQLAARYPAYAAALAEKSGDEKVDIEVQQQVGAITGEGKLTGVHIEHLDVSRVSAEDAFVRVIRQPLEALYRAQPDTQVVILVDGLDESLLYTGEIGILSLLAQAEAMPKNVRLLLTSRKDARIEGEFPEAEGLFISDNQFDNQNHDDVQKYMERRAADESLLAAKLSQLPSEQQQLIFHTINSKTAGNFRYVTFLLDEIIAGKRDLVDLSGLPEGLDQLYYQSLERLVRLGKKTWEEMYAPVMGVLMVVQSRLHLNQLMQFTSFGNAKIWSALGDLEQFLQRGESEASEQPFTYQLYHQSVSDFLGKPYIQLKKNQIPNRFYLLAETWHRRIADYYWDRYHADWSRLHDAYGLNNLAQHLYESAQFQRLQELIHQAWMLNRFEEGGYTHDGFLRDLDLAWKHAYDEARRHIDRAEFPMAFAENVRLALICTSLNSLSTNYVPELVARAVKTGLWPPQRALSLAQRVAGAQKKVKLYTALLQTEPFSDKDLRLQTQERGLETVLAIRDETDRALALAALAPQLEKTQREQALQRGLDAALAIRDKAYRANALVALAPHLEHDLLQRGLEAASAIEDDHDRADALAALAPHLEGDLLQRGLEAALAIRDEASRADALAALAPQLEGKLLERALKAALTISWQGFRVKVLAALAPQLEGKLLQRALKAALAIRDETDRAEALVALTPHLEKTQRKQVLQRELEAALAIRDKKSRAEALAALAPQLEKTQREQALQRGLEAALAITRQGYRAEALAALAPHLEGDLLQRGLKAALAIQDEWYPAPALAALAPRLEKTQREQAMQHALKAALAIRNQVDRAHALAALAPQLEGELLQRGLEAALAIRDEGSRADALAALAPQLEGDLLQRGLEAALVIWDDRSRADALAALAPYLEGDLLQRGLKAALAIRDEASRAAALAALAPHLEGDLLQRGLEAALTIRNEASRADALAAVAPHLEKIQREQVLQRELETALTIRNEAYRAYTLAALAPYLESDLLQRVLDAALAIRDEWYRARALAVLAPHLEHDLLQRGLDAAFAIQDYPSRREALAALVSHLEGDLLQRGLEAALAMRDAKDQARALAALAPQLEKTQKEQVLQRGLEAALAIRDEAYRAEALAILAPHLEKIQREQVLQRELETALAMRDEKDQARALAALAPQLEKTQKEQVLQRGLEAALAIRDQGDRARALVALAPHLEGDLLQRGLKAALAIQEAWLGANALAGFFGVVPNQPVLLHDLRVTMVDHLSRDLRGATREAVLGFIADKNIFSPPILDAATLQEIANSVIEICEEWTWA